MPGVDTSATEDAFDRMIADIQAASEQAVVAAALELKSHAAELEPHKSGSLAGSLTIEGGARSAGEDTPTIWSAKVGPTKPGYTRRMELGFHGRDRKGRTYHQSGHWALQRSEKDILLAYGARLAEVWGRALGGP